MRYLAEELAIDADSAEDYAARLQEATLQHKDPDLNAVESLTSAEGAGWEEGYAHTLGPDELGGSLYVDIGGKHPLVAIKEDTDGDADRYVLTRIDGEPGRPGEQLVVEGENQVYVLERGGEDGQPQYRITYHGALNTEGASLAQDDPAFQERADLLFRIADRWEQVRGATDDSEAARYLTGEEDAEGYTLQNTDQGKLERLYGNTLDRLASKGEVTLHKSTHVGGARGSNILQEILSAIRRMEDRRGIDPGDIDLGYDENWPTITYTQEGEAQD